VCMTLEPDTTLYSSDLSLVRRENPRTKQRRVLIAFDL